LARSLGEFAAPHGQPVEMIRGEAGIRVLRVEHIGHRCREGGRREHGRVPERGDGRQNNTVHEGSLSYCGYNSDRRRPLELPAPMAGMIADCTALSRFINDPKEEMDLLTAIETRSSAGRVSAP